MTFKGMTLLGLHLNLDWFPAIFRDNVSASLDVFTRIASIVEGNWN